MKSKHSIILLSLLDIIRADKTLIPNHTSLYSVFHVPFLKTRVCDTDITMFTIVTHSLCNQLVA